MDSFRGFESAGDKDCMVVDTEWNMEDHVLSERDLVNTLLDVSEECIAKDQDGDELGSHTGWEEAVQGWGRGPSVICLFQMQRRGRRIKTTDADFHCLLCVDAKASELHESETTTESPGFYGGLPERNTKKTIPNKGDLLKAGPSSKSSVKTTAELLQKQNILAKQFSGVDGLLIKSAAATCLGRLSHHQEDQCPLLKDRCASGNVTLVNCFAVLPPLKVSLDGNVISPNYPKRGAVAVGGNMQDMADIWHRGTSATADSSREMKAHAHLYSSRSAEDSLHSSIASKYCTCKNSHRLLKTFSIPIVPKRCDHDQPFPTMDDAVPHVTYRLGRYPRQEELARLAVRNPSGNKLCLGYKTKNIRQAEPELPMLFGTRVAIPASAHRL